VVLDLRSDDGRFHKSCSTVDNPVSHSINADTRGHRLKGLRYRLAMGWSALTVADVLHQSRIKRLSSIGVDDLVLEGRGPRVEDQNLH